MGISAHTFQPIALPQLAGADALEAASLVIGASCHRSAMDLVDNAVLSRPYQRTAEQPLDATFRTNQHHDLIISKGLPPSGTRFRISTSRGFPARPGHCSRRPCAGP